MTHPPDDQEWSRLAADWRGGGPTAPAVEELLRGVRRRMRRVTLLDLLAGGAVLAVPLMLFDMLRHHPEAVSVGLSVVVALHIAGLWGLLLWSRRGRARPLGESGSDFLRAGMRHCRKEIAVIAALAAVLAVELFAFSFYLGRFTSRQGLTEHLFAVGAMEELVAALGFLVLFAIALALRWRRTSATLRALESHLRETHPLGWRDRAE